MNCLISAWYKSLSWTRVLLPLTWMYVWQVKKNQRRYILNKEPTWQASVPVIVVGNITVGGTGKTPLTAAIVQRLKQEGYTPGIVSRGYKGKAEHYPLWVTPESVPFETGDEALMLAQQTGVPVVVDPNRVHAVQYLLNRTNCDVVVSDDGLQHMALGRDIEIVVIDAARGLGNGYCLPAGPLREPATRLQKVHFIVLNGADTHSGIDGFHMQLKPTRVVNLSTRRAWALTEWAEGKRIHAVSGIGHPARFFSMLRDLGFEVIEHPLPDHYALTTKDITFADDLPVMMTAKDAVKCYSFASTRHFAVDVEASLHDDFWRQLLKQLSWAAVVKKSHVDSITQV